MIHIIFDDSKLTPSINLYNAYCVYIAMKIRIFRGSTYSTEIFRGSLCPTEAVFAEKFTNATGISQIDGHYRFRLREFNKERKTTSRK